MNITPVVKAKKMNRNYAYTIVTNMSFMLLFASLLFSCKENSKNNPSNSNTPQQKDSPNVGIEEDSEQLFFRGNGSEPGWNLTITKKSEVLNYTLALENAEIRKEGVLQLKRLDQSNYAIFEVLGEDQDIEIQLKMEACNDMAGNIHESSILLSNKGKLYFGCGDFFSDTPIKKVLQSSNMLDHYICYRNDNKKDKKIWIGFNADDIALKVKYEGQTEEINLRYWKSEYIEGGAHPTTVTYYKELYGGVINGVYKTTHSGNWDYVEYTRKKDSKIFKFTIDHTLDPYEKSPCF